MAPRPVVVMGVAGSGKSVVGRAVAERTDRPFVDADDLHPPANVAKMRRGEALDDHDRAPWLDAVSAVLANGAGTVVACSALKRVYRDRLRRHVPEAWIVHLDGPTHVIAERMAARTDHFMPLSLLDDQVATLEALAADEPGMAVSIEGSLDDVIAAALDALP
ncbi:MAG: gluconokinase [Actinomycetota bacterium]